MEEVRQLKADKTKEKGSQHDPDHAVDREETLAGGVPRNAKQHFITMEARESQNTKGEVLRTKTSLPSKGVQQTIPREV